MADLGECWRDTTWQHVKTQGLYRIIRLANMESDGSPMVVYEAAHEPMTSWTRPLKEFFDGRFRAVEDEDEE